MGMNVNQLKCTSRWYEINFTSTCRFCKSCVFTIPVEKLFVYIVLLSYLPC